VDCEPSTSVLILAGSSVDSADDGSTAEDRSSAELREAGGRVSAGEFSFEDLRTPAILLPDPVSMREMPGRVLEPK